MAAEPLGEDPIAFDWSADGKLWVVEMGDYPLGTDGKGKFGGVVRVLEDTNGDSRYDKSTIFLDGLGFPTGLIPWRKGVIIACAPDIFYAEDRDGDGKADHREVLFTGFNQGNQQHRVNGFDLGLDGWLYGANGDSGGNIRSLKTGKMVSISGRDFRFQPDTGEFEPESGQTQFGRHRDDWGHWFGNNNPNWGWHYVLSDADLRRNPRLAVRDTRHMLELETPCFPVSRTVARFNDFDMANRVTSANSSIPYRDELFGPHFQNSFFVSEPVHNLVHRMNLEHDGVTLRGVRAPDETDREFLASSDNWFRPTMIKTGPDGALWIADMYRAVIEHPQWIPDDWEKRIDLRAGSTEGRIYRIRPVDKTPRPIPRLDRLDTRGLVAALDSPNGWQRDTAQRLLMHRQDPTAEGLIQLLLLTTKRPQTRVQALWTLAVLDGLDPEGVGTLMNDPNPQVRRNAIKVSEFLVNRAGAVVYTVNALLQKVDDPDPEVRLQLALSLGATPDRRAGRALGQLMRENSEDRWFRAAALSSAKPHVASLLGRLFGFRGRPGEPLPNEFVEPLFELAGSTDDPQALASIAERLAAPRMAQGRFAPWQFAALAGLLDVAGRSGRPLDPDLLKSLDGLASAARQIAADHKAEIDQRVAAVNLLGRDPARRDDDRERLVQLLRPQVPGVLQQAAIAALARGGDDRKVPEVLLAGWRGSSPQLRSTILDTLLSRRAWTAALLSSLEDRCTPPAEIDPTHRNRLLNQRDKTLKERALAVFKPETGPRQDVVASYRSALTTPGNADAGAAVFKRICANCHRLGDVGTEVGPDLATLQDKSPEALLIAILDPNRAFEARYSNFTVQTADGRVLTGMIASETATSVTLRRQEGQTDVLLRADIEEMVTSGQSLMPEGLEKDLTPRDLGDLIAFLASAKPPSQPEARTQASAQPPSRK
jgi:putative membrane-bound dehydrogenase-like protein